MDLDGVRDLLDAGAPVADVSGLAHRSEVAALCIIAGAPEMAAGLIQQPNISLAAVRKKLLAHRVGRFSATGADGTAVEIETTFLPVAEQSPGAGRFLAAVNRLLAKTGRKAKA
jgi:hypothetical protein